MTDLIRGTIVSFGERGEYTGKPRPGIVIQHSSTLTLSPSVTLCGLTTFEVPPNRARVPLIPSDANGLRSVSYAMVDKIVSISRTRIGRVIGTLDRRDLDVLDGALRRWLDL